MMTLKAAKEIAGTLGNPSKMPGKAYGIPAKDCNVGAILAKLMGTVCHECYALKGNYTFPSVTKSQQKRLASLYHEQWVEAMARQILHADEEEFRWHDSGDLDAIPDNMIIRISGTKVNGGATKRWPWTSTVHDDSSLSVGEICGAYTREGKCGPCRMCWNKDVPNVSYPKH